MRCYLGVLVFMLAGSLSALQIGDEVHFMRGGKHSSGKVECIEKNGQVLVRFREFRLWIYAKDLAPAAKTLNGLSVGDCVAFDGVLTGTINKIFANGMLQLKYFRACFPNKAWREMQTVTRNNTCLR